MDDPVSQVELDWVAVYTAREITMINHLATKWLKVQKCIWTVPPSQAIQMFTHNLAKLS